MTNFKYETLSFQFMQVTRTSFLSRVTRTLDVPITEEQLRTFENKEVPLEEWKKSLPPFSDWIPMFLATGVIADDWDILKEMEDQELRDKGLMPSDEMYEKFGCNNATRVDVDGEQREFDSTNPAHDPNINPWIDVFGPGDEAEDAYWNTD